MQSYAFFLHIRSNPLEKSTRFNGLFVSLRPKGREVVHAQKNEQALCIRLFATLHTTIYSLKEFMQQRELTLTTAHAKKSFHLGFGKTPINMSTISYVKVKKYCI
jgi:hypothetical protein